MADVKISGLPASTTPLAGTEVLPIVQGGATKQVSIANVTAGRSVAALSVVTPTIQAEAGSAGGTIKNGSGVAQMQWGSGGASNLSLEVATNINPVNAAVSIAPTGTGTVTINPATASTMNNVAIGGTTPLAGKFTGLEATGVATFSAGTVSAPAITTTGDTNTGIFFPAADTIAFTEGGVESIRITSASLVGIGTSSPSGKLSVKTSTMTNQVVVDSIFDANTYGLISLNGNRDATDFLGIAGGGGTDKTMFLGVPASGKFSFRNTFSEQMVLDSSNNLTVSTGNLIIGTSGKGIDFSATAGTGTSELLADYEEGVWTPTIKNSGGTLQTLTTAAGTYRKVGTKVTVWFTVVSSDDLTDNNYYFLEGLPFASASAAAPNYYGTAYTPQTTISRGSTHAIQADTTSRFYIFTAQVSGSLNTFAFADTIYGVATYISA
jgi:hypothetical protein